jgi:hypothetical protein
MIAQKEHTAPQHTRFILPPIHPTKSSLRCVGGIFLFWELLGAKPLHLAILLRKTVPLLKSPTGAFIAALRLQTRSHPKPCSWFAPDGANSNGVSCLHNFTEELSNRQEVQ